jgi:mono/diheme cytochrome c family protein
LAHHGRCICTALSIIAALWLLAATSARADEPGPVTNPFAGRTDMADEGHGLFNQYCAHCHGPNAIQGERPRDLRRLRIRYGDKAPEVFLTTISTGRPDKGMPVWKGVLSDEVLWRIFTYLESVQTKP